MPNPRTMVTEVGTGLGMLGLENVDAVLAARPAAMRTLAPEDWDALTQLRDGGTYSSEFHAAWENGRAFLSASEGLRGRRPETVEWKGAIRAPGDEVAPIDLRVDHVYLISCKYLSNILFNVSPTHVFDQLLVGGSARGRREQTLDWFGEVAPDAYQALYALVRAALRQDGGNGAAKVQRDRLSPAGAQALPGLGVTGTTTNGDAVALHSAAELAALPARANELTVAQRRALSTRLASGWPPESKAAYEALSEEVAGASAARWRAALAGGKAAAEAMLWRLLRIGATPYFVLGSSSTHTLRLRIATSWDWRQHFALRTLEIFAQSGGQPRVGWEASIKDRASGELHSVAGHVEVRWSHGRFGGPPEAKGYLDTPHPAVPGYFALR